MALGKTVYVVFVVAILVVAAGAAVVVKNNSDDGHVNTPESLNNAVLKVYGNIDGDEDIDQDDVKTIEKLIHDKATAADYPMADANRDGTIDQKDVDVVKKIIDGESTEIWHISYHDVDGDSVMDEELVKTKFPIKSTIMTGSTNSFILMTMCGIVDEVKGASYSSTVDKALFGETFLNTDKVAKLGTSSTKIEFEAGASASSNLIQEKNVTALISDWNRTYIINESDFEKAGVDVVRVAASSVDLNVNAHSILLLGLLFQKQDRTKALYELYDSVYSELSSKKPSNTIRAVASSTDGGVSSGNSDYTKVLTYAGAIFGLEGFDFGTSTYAKVDSNKDIYTYDFDYLIHLRTSVSYGEYDATAIWNNYTSKFPDLNPDVKQYVVSGTVPVPVRIALVASIFNDSVDIDWANNIHQKFLDTFLQKYNYETGTFESYGFDLSQKSFIISGPAS